MRIKGYAFYSHHLRHLEGWRRDRVVLIGDARAPDATVGRSGAYGRASATRTNVAWKLTAVCRGEVDDAVLDTVEAERWPHVRLLTEMSVRLGMFIEADQRALVAVRNTVGPGPASLLEPRPPAEQRHQPVHRRLGHRPTGSAQRPGPDGPAAVGLRPNGAASTCSTTWSATVSSSAPASTPRRDDRPTGQACAGSRARFRTVRTSFATTDGPDDVIDHTGVLTGWMRRHRANVVVMRPRPLRRRDRHHGARRPGHPQHPAAAVRRPERPRP